VVAGHGKPLWHALLIMSLRPEPLQGLAMGVLCRRGNPICAREKCDRVIAAGEVQHEARMLLDYGRSGER
jgi:hypothetical protein